MKLITALGLSAAVIAPAYGQDATCPADAVSCTISVQDAGHNDTAATAENTESISAMAGNSSASNQSGNDIHAAYDNSAQTTQNATTQTGAVTATGGAATGNRSDNRSAASNGDQTMGQSNTGTSSASTGASHASNGPQTIGNLSTGASTSQGGSVGNTSASGGSVGNLSTGPSNSSSSTTVGPNTAVTGPASASIGDLSTGASSAAVGDIGGNTQLSHLSNGSASTIGDTLTASGAMSGGNTMTGGANTSDASNSGGNSSVEIDAADRSTNTYRSRTTFIPPVIPGTPAGTVAVGNIVKETTACGPLQAIVRTPVVGSHRGIFGKSAVEQGYTYDVAPFLDDQGRIVDYREVPLPDGSGWQRYGHQLVFTYAVIGVSGGGNLSLGGGGNGGAFGQAGTGSSSNHTRLVTNIQAISCDAGARVFVQPYREQVMPPEGDDLPLKQPRG